MFDGLFLQDRIGAPEFRWHTIALAAVIALGTADGSG